MLKFVNTLIKLHYLQCVIFYLFHILFIRISFVDNFVIKNIISMMNNLTMNLFIYIHNKLM